MAKFLCDPCFGKNSIMYIIGSNVEDCIGTSLYKSLTYLDNRFCSLEYNNCCVFSSSCNNVFRFSIEFICCILGMFVEKILFIKSCTSLLSVDCDSCVFNVFVFSTSCGSISMMSSCSSCFCIISFDICDG
ncbi:hypothetical protein MRV_0047 [Murid herpesvirus 3]|uniref:Uncharacterized protein n=2 Tax=Murid betaherpesvirus 3 TaxID=2560603 RepID=A0A1P8VIT8_9BETA|nr:hypothetical protein MRV_0047 [Murine roseolovirus]APZ76258.1 hypothetical protein MRV_0047 [Murid betaherpesvirus 3]AYH64803.1 hypothetical protein MRV_0047 [Murid herpesvirus 3]